MRYLIKLSPTFCFDQILCFTIEHEQIAQIKSTIPWLMNIFPENRYQKRKFVVRYLVSYLSLINFHFPREYLAKTFYDIQEIYEENYK